MVVIYLSLLISAFLGHTSHKNSESSASPNSDPDITLNNLTHLSTLSLNTLLFGNQELSNAANKQITDIVNDHILKTKGFQVQ